jgi:hypothetical protein
MDKDTKAAFTKLTKTVTDGFATVDKRFTAVESILTKQGKELHDLTETVGFVVKNMATKDDIKELKDQITAVASKVSGTNRRLDDEAMLRTDLALPKRVSDLEEKTFGASRQPAHIPLK